MPSIATLHTTPTMRRKYHVYSPAFWRTIQANDLTAWLNSILIHQSLIPHITSHTLSTNILFQHHLSAISNLYKNPTITPILSKVDAEITAGRFFITRKIHMATHHHFRNKLVEILLLNYHPMWLLLALSAVLSRNLAFHLDRTFQQLRNRPVQPDHDKVFMAVLEDLLKNFFLKDHIPHPNFSTSSTSTARTTPQRSPDSSHKDPFNAMVLSRVLHLVFLLDSAKQHKPSILPSDPPLFRFGSEISSSEEVIEQLGKDFLPDHGDVVRFLTFRGYRVTYVTPLLERDSLVVRRLDKDLCDGVRLCKLASLLTKDRSMLTNIRRVKNGMSRKEVFACHLGNVSLALSKMQGYAVNHLGRSVKWKATHHDIVTGDVDKTIAILWQISSLWLEINVLDTETLTSELRVVEQEFREAKRQSEVSKWSPGGTAKIPNLDEHVVSPSRLTVYESCETKAGRLLLRWCATVAGMYGIAVRDFTESFRDAAPLCVILHHYCPEILKAEEFLHVKQAELRSVCDSEAEAEIVQKNFDLFNNRIRLLGAIPDIPIRSEAALAPPFTEGKKEESFGRVMELLASYLFRRLTLEKKGQTETILPECFLLQPEASKDVPPPPRETLRPDSHTPKRQEQALRETDDSTQETDRVLDLKCLEHSMNAEKNIPAESQAISKCSDQPNPEIERLREKNSNEKPPGGEALSMAVVEGPSGSPSSASETFSSALSKVSSANRHESGSLLSRKKNAARAILWQYRAGKRRRDFETRRDSAVAIQASARGYLSREQSSSLTREKNISGVRAALEIGSIKEFGEGFLSAKSSPTHLGTQANLSHGYKDEMATNAARNLIDHTSLLLPLFRDHMEGISAFSARMVFHERNQASLSIQRCFRAHQAANSAVVSTSGGIEQDKINIPWLKLTSGVFRVARSIAKGVLSELQSQRRIVITSLSDGLQSAEEAYEEEMNIRRVRASHDTEAVNNRRNEQINTRRRFEDEELQSSQVLDEGMQLLDGEMAALDTRYHEAITICESDQLGIDYCDLTDVEIYHDSSFSSENPEIFGDLGKEHPEGNAPVEDIFHFEDLEEIRKREQSILDDIEKAQAQLSANLGAREQELQKLRAVVLVAALYKSEYEFDSYMRSSGDSQAKYIKQLSEREEEYSEIEAAIEGLNREEEIEMRAICRLLDVIEDKCKHAEEVFGNELDTLSLGVSAAYDAAQDLEGADERERKASFLSSIQGKSLELETSRFSRAWEEFDAWRKEADNEQNMLDETIDLLERQAIQKASTEQMRSLLEKAEFKYNSAMEKSTAKANEHEVERQENRMKLDSIEKEEEVSREHLHKNVRSLNEALTGLDAMMEERRSYMNKLLTPIRNPAAVSPAISIRSSTVKMVQTPGTNYHKELMSSIEDTLNLIEAQELSINDDIELYKSTELSSPDQNDGREGEHVSSLPVLSTTGFDSEGSAVYGGSEKMSDNLKTLENVDSVVAETERKEFDETMLDESEECVEYSASPSTTGYTSDQAAVSSRASFEDRQWPSAHNSSSLVSSDTRLTPATMEGNARVEEENIDLDAQSIGLSGGKDEAMLQSPVPALCSPLGSADTGAETDLGTPSRASFDDRQCPSAHNSSSLVSSDTRLALATMEPDAEVEEENTDLDAQSIGLSGGTDEAMLQSPVPALCSPLGSAGTRAETDLGTPSRASFDDRQCPSAHNSSSLVSSDTRLALATMEPDAEVEEENTDLDAQSIGLSGGTDEAMMHSPVPALCSPLGTEGTRTETDLATIVQSGAESLTGSSAGREANEFCDSAEDVSESHSESDISNWTNESTRGSPLPLERSPNWTGNAGSSLTSKRSSLRDSNPAVFTPIENQIGHRELSRGEGKDQKSLIDKRVPQTESRKSSSLQSQDYSSREEWVVHTDENSAPAAEIREVGLRAKSTKFGDSNIGTQTSTQSNEPSLSVPYSAVEVPVQTASLGETNSSGLVAGSPEPVVTASEEREGQGSSSLQHTPESDQGATQRWLKSASSRSGPSPSSFESPLPSWPDRTPTVPSGLLSNFLRTNAFSSLEKPSQSEWGSVPLPAWDSSYKIATPSSGGLSVLRRLSLELSELKREICMESNNERMALGRNEEQLGNVLRRISMASAAHANQGGGEETTFDVAEEFSVLNIIRIICIIIRRYRRSESHVELVEIGISILRDMCKSPDWVDNIFLVEDCLAEIVRCVQFHRDNEKIIVAALEALLAISNYSSGEALLRVQEGLLKRLRGVNKILKMEAERESECAERLRRTNIVLRAIENRRKNQSAAYFTHELAEARREVPEFTPETRRSVKLLQSLLDRFPCITQGTS